MFHASHHLVILGKNPLIIGLLYSFGVCNSVIIGNYLIIDDMYHCTLIINYENKDCSVPRNQDVLLGFSQSPEAMVEGTPCPMAALMAFWSTLYSPCAMFSLLVKQKPARYKHI